MKRDNTEFAISGINHLALVCGDNVPSECAAWTAEFTEADVAPTPATAADRARYLASTKDRPAAVWGQP